MANKNVVNVRDINITAVEKNMEKMSAACANRLGEPTKKATAKKSK